MDQTVDVLIVGAGLSGIGAAVHLQDKCPGKTYAIVEARDAIGGTWDLFRYPGIRSDSDMYTLGYSFKPWKAAKAIADGPSIREYVQETAREHGIEQHIRFNHKVVNASWCSQSASWTVDIETSAGVEQYRCNFLFMCSGYYRYDEGYTPEFGGREDFSGQIIHPQHWPQGLDYSGKRVVVIGSGATAVTLVPAMAETAAHVTMLQRSPSYFLSRPWQDAIANFLKRIFPAQLAYDIVRWKNVLLTMYFYNMCKQRPEDVKRYLRKGLRKALGPDFDLDTHFKPRYNPWDQRLCLVPDDDLFKALRQGKTDIVTDEIEGFIETGIQLKSGKTLEADIIVTATGLNLLALGGMQINVDGREVDISETLGYRGMMLSDVPNMAVALGYTNASWTLKCDLTCEFVCRLLNHMDQHGYRECRPHNDDPGMEREAFIDFSSSYVQRAIDRFPKQGARKPWRLYQNYLKDIFSLRYGKLEDGAMRFSRAAAEESSTAESIAS